MSDEPLPQSEIILYQTEDGRTRIQCRFEDETVWLSLTQLADLLQRDKSVISRHIKNVFEEGELVRSSVVAKSATTAADEKTYQVEYYNLRDIRSSERRFYQKVLDIYATSVDYTPNMEMSQQFFATVQNKMHWAAHGQAAAELNKPSKP